MREAERKRVISSSAIHSRKHPHERACRHMCRARLRASERPDDFGCSGFSLVGCVKLKTIIRRVTGGGVGCCCCCLLIKCLFGGEGGKIAL